jgi:hypothetical protein
VEKAFALVKAWLREHEVAATNNPVLWLNRAFEQIKIGGPGAQIHFGHWALYFKAREIMLQDALL